MLHTVVSVVSRRFCKYVRTTESAYERERLWFVNMWNSRQCVANKVYTLEQSLIALTPSPVAIEILFPMQIRNLWPIPSSHVKCGDKRSSSSSPSSTVTRHIGEHLETCFQILVNLAENNPIVRERLANARYVSIPVESYAWPGSVCATAFPSVNLFENVEHIDFGWTHNGITLSFNDYSSALIEPMYCKRVHHVSVCVDNAIRVGELLSLNPTTFRRLTVNHVHIPWRPTSQIIVRLAYEDDIRVRCQLYDVFAACRELVFTVIFPVYSGSVYCDDSDKTGFMYDFEMFLLLPHLERVEFVQSYMEHYPPWRNGWHSVALLMSLHGFVNETKYSDAVDVPKRCVFTAHQRCVDVAPCNQPSTRLGAWARNYRRLHDDDRQ